MPKRRADQPFSWPLWLEAGFGRSFELELRLDGDGPVPVRIVRLFHGLPTDLGLAPRPDWTVDCCIGNSTVVGRTFRF